MPALLTKSKSSIISKGLRLIRRRFARGTGLAY